MIINTFIAAIFCDLVTDSYASIAGVTYMDDFDFEQRYRNINECNPLYWHPLHLPDDCAEMFEKAIRSRIKSNVPIRLVKERAAQVIEIPYGSSGYGAEVFQAPIRTEMSYYGHPFGKMLELLSRDVKDQPRAPTVGLLPNVGLVALYQQPISRRSEKLIKLIKKIADVYRPSAPVYSPPFIWPFEKDNSTEGGKTIVKIKPKTSKKRNHTIKSKIKKGRS